MPAQQNLKSLYSGRNWVQSHIQSIWFQQHLTLSRLHPRNSSHCGNCWQNRHSKNRGVGEEPQVACPGLAPVSTGSHVLLMLSSSMDAGNHFTCLLGTGPRTESECWVSKVRHNSRLPIASLGCRSGKPGLWQW